MKSVGSGNVTRAQGWLELALVHLGHASTLVKGYGEEGRATTPCLYQWQHPHYAFMINY